jgi:cyclic pyranopterin monophosphate synthase
MLLCAPVKHYAFDDAGEALHLVPLAARRALDHGGIKLSLEGWRSLSLERRRELALAGEGASVDVARVRTLTAEAQPAPTSTEPVVDPLQVHVPPELALKLGDARPLSDSLWATLSALDRYVLVKLASSSRSNRLDDAYREIVGHSASSPHIAPQGGVRMVDVSPKAETERRAVAESVVKLGDRALERLLSADAPKGDVLGTARVAGIMGAKRTSDLIPLCHPIPLSHVGVDLTVDRPAGTLTVRATVIATARTGVEMEAMVAASAAALTVYDMLKAFDRGIEIGPTRLLEKSGGRTGDFRR